MTLNRILTTLIQLAFGIPVIYLVREMYRDIKSGNFFPKE